MAVPTTDALRTLNLAYRHMCGDFENFAEELFRANETITTDANGYLILPTYVTEIELIVTTSNTDEKWYRIAKETMYWNTGYYHDGIDLVSNKRRLMVRDGGNPKTSAILTVQYLREYNDLSATTDPPVPFVGKRYLDMLTNLQAYYYYIELGQEKAADAQRHLDIYQKTDLPWAMQLYFDNQAEYGMTSSNDAGSPRRYPVLHPSTS